MSSQGSSRCRTLATLVCVLALCAGAVRAAQAAPFGGGPAITSTPQGSWMEGTAADLRFWLAAQLGRVAHLTFPASFWPGTTASRRALPEGTSMVDPNGIGTTGGGNGGPIIVLPPHP